MTQAEMHVFHEWLACPLEAMEPSLPESAVATYRGLSGPRRDDVVRCDREVIARRSHADTPDAYRALLRAFKDSPMTGCTSALDLARQQAKYEPSADRSQQGFERYLDRIRQSGLFTDSSYDTFAPKVVTRFDDFLGRPPEAEFLKYATDFYKDLEPAEKRRVMLDLETFLRGAFRDLSARHEQLLFLQSALDAGGTNRAILYYCQLRASVTVFASSHTPMIICMVEGPMCRFRADLDNARWAQCAEDLMRKHIKTVDEWLG
jgi:hypothetical protein